MLLHADGASHQIFRMHQSRPGVVTQRLQLFERVAQHGHILVVVNALAGMHIPFPGAHVGAFQNGLQAPLLPAQFGTASLHFELGQMHLGDILECAHQTLWPVVVKTHLTKDAHPTLLALRVDELHHHVPGRAVLLRFAHRIAQAPTVGSGIKTQGHLLGGAEVRRHAVYGAGLRAEQNLACTQINLPGSDTGNAPGAVQKSLHLAQTKLHLLALGDIGMNAPYPLRPAVPGARHDLGAGQYPHPAAILAQRPQLAGIVVGSANNAICRGRIETRQVGVMQPLVPKLVGGR